MVRRRRRRREGGRRRRVGQLDWGWGVQGEGGPGEWVSRRGTGAPWRLRMTVQERVSSGTGGGEERRGEGGGVLR